MANPSLQTVNKSLPQTGGRSRGSRGQPFWRASRKMTAFGFLTSFAADLVTHQLTPQLPAAPGFLRGLTLEIAVAGGAAAGATYQPDAPFSYINAIQFRDILNTLIIQLTGFELYLVNLFSGQVGDAGMQNPTVLPSFSAGTAAGNFQFRLLVPFELNRTGYGSLMAASQQTPMQVILTLNPLTATGAVYNAAPANQTGQTVTVKINQLYWSLRGPDVDAVKPYDLGASHQWSSAGSGTNLAANAQASAIMPPQAGWMSALICTLRDSSNTNGAGPARVGSLPTTDLGFLVDGVPWINRGLLDELQDKLVRNFSLAINGNAADPAQPLAASSASPSPTLTRGVMVFTFRDSVQESVTAADTLDELVEISTGTRVEVSGTWGAAGTPPFTLTFTIGVLVPTQAANGLPYSHLAA